MDQIEAIVLGTAQDGGVPQANCDCENCGATRAVSARRRLVASLGIVDRRAGSSWIIDATPDFPEQLYQLREAAPECELSGILLTHAHIGHYTGLIHLGKEVMSTSGTTVHATDRMSTFLRANQPWSSLVEGTNIELSLIGFDAEIELSPDVGITAIQVPHRDELSDTVAYIIEGPEKRIFYCPDIDSWDEWDRDLRDVVESVDIALIDGTFGGPDELGGRDEDQVPHPFITDTVERLRGVESEVYLTHLNHTNRLLIPCEAAEFSCSTGLLVAADGDSFTL